jgi:hypothetical protein
MHDAARPTRRRQPARRLIGVGRALILVLAVALLGGSCRDGGESSEPAPTTTTLGGAPLANLADTPVEVPETLPFPPGYQLADTRHMELTPVTGPRRDTPPPPPVAMEGGRSHLAGVVIGPGGPVGGAILRIERFVGDASGSRDIVAGPDGSFRLNGLPGGRYRLRAWQQPALATTRPLLSFLAADGGQEGLEVRVERRNATTVHGAIGVRAWRPGNRAGVSVLVSQEHVDGNGIVRARGVPDVVVNLQVPSGLSLLTGSSAATGADGYAHFGVVCTATGQHTITAESTAITRAITAPPCEVPPPPTTTTTTTTVTAAATATTAASSTATAGARSGAGTEGPQ